MMLQRRACLASKRLFSTSVRVRIGNNEFESDKSTGTLTLHPQTGHHHIGTVVLMHGIGDTAKNIAEIAGVLSQALSHVKFVLPTAKRRPIQMEGGQVQQLNSWFEISGPSCPGIEESDRAIQNILEKEHNLGIPYSRMVLAGIQEGGAMALYTGLQLPTAAQKLAGIAVVSGSLPHASLVNVTPGLESTPICHIHGTEDDRIPAQVAEVVRDVLIETKKVTDYKLLMHSGGSEGIDGEMFSDLHDYLTSVLPDNEDSQSQTQQPQEAVLLETRKQAKDMSVAELFAEIRSCGLTSQAVGVTKKDALVALLEAHWAKKTEGNSS